MRPNMFARVIPDGQGSGKAEGNFIDNLLNDLSMMTLLALGTIYMAFILVCVLIIILYSCYCLQQKELYEEARANMRAIKEAEALQKDSESDEDENDEDEMTLEADSSCSGAPPPSELHERATQVGGATAGTPSSSGSPAGAASDGTCSAMNGMKEASARRVVIASAHCSVAISDSSSLSHDRCAGHDGATAAAGEEAEEEEDTNRWRTTFAELISDDKNSARNMQALHGILTVPVDLTLENPFDHGELRGNYYRWRQAVERRRMLSEHLPTLFTSRGASLPAGTRPTAAPRPTAASAAEVDDDDGNDDNDVILAGATALDATVANATALLGLDSAGRHLDNDVATPEGSKGREGRMISDAAVNAAANVLLQQHTLRPVGSTTMMGTVDSYDDMPLSSHQNHTMTMASSATSQGTSGTVPSVLRTGGTATAAGNHVVCFPSGAMNGGVGIGFYSGGGASGVYAGGGGLAMPSLSDPTYGIGLRHRHSVALGQSGGDAARSGEGVLVANGWHRSRRHRSGSGGGGQSTRRNRRKVRGRSRDREIIASAAPGHSDSGDGHAEVHDRQDVTGGGGSSLNVQQRLELTVSMLRSAGTEYPLDTTADLVPSFKERQL